VNAYAKDWEEADERVGDWSFLAEERHPISNEKTD
jgi:hypothetical protein